MWAVLKDIASTVGLVVMAILALISLAGRAFDWRDLQETARYSYGLTWQEIIFGLLALSFFFTAGRLMWRLRGVYKEITVLKEGNKATQTRSSLFAIQALAQSGLPTFFMANGNSHRRIGSPDDKDWRGVPKGGTLELALSIGTTAIPEAQLESISLRIMGKFILLEWQSRKIVHMDIWEVFYVPIPDWVTPGEHPIGLVGNFNGEDVESPTFTMTFPKQ